MLKWRKQPVPETCVFSGIQIYPSELNFLAGEAEAGSGGDQPAKE